MSRKLKLQSAIDFISAYGIAIVIIAATVLIVYKIAFVSQGASFCTPSPGFSCNFIAINTSGVLVLKVSQATGTSIKINGAACADQQNYTGDNPLYGNVNVNGMAAFYPPPNYPPGNSIYSGSTYSLYLYCYSGGAVVKGSIGNQFTGYVWLNYSIPNYGNQVEKIITFQTQYT